MNRNTLSARLSPQLLDASSHYGSRTPQQQWRLERCNTNLEQIHNHAQKLEGDLPIKGDTSLQSNTGEDARDLHETEATPRLGNGSLNWWPSFGWSKTPSEEVRCYVLYADRCADELKV